jgi:hypothetical protein
MIELFKSLHNMNPRLATACEQSVQELILRGIETMNFLMSIKGFQGFDCQTLFLQNEGLKALLGIRAILDESQFY